MLVIVSIRVLPGEAMVMISRERRVVGLHPYAAATYLAGRVLLEPGQGLDQDREDSLAVDAGQRQGDLRLDHPELDSQVEPRAAGLDRQVSFPPGQRVQCGRELDLAQFANIVVDQGSSRSKTVGVSTCMPKKQR